MDCENCAYFAYDEYEDDWYCTVDMDEDDCGRLMSGAMKACPYFVDGDEYKVVRHQM